MPTSFIERERKFDVEHDFDVPDLLAVVPPGSVLRSSIEHLRSDYFDTPTGSLRRAGLTLRRRTGTDDVGWQLKLPSGEHREEIRFALTDEVPAELEDLLLGVTRGAPLRTVATLDTERHVTRVVDGAGAPVADVDLDHVRASTNVDGEARVSGWTELEVELAGPSVSDEQLAVLARALLDAGARPATTRSKLARALDEASTGAATAGWRSEEHPKKGRNGKKKRERGRLEAGSALVPYLAEQERALLLGDLALRRGDDGAIHPTRVATRRLRSAIRVFAPLFDDERSRSLDEELSWYAEVLGAVRDSQVLEQRLHRDLDEIPSELVLGPVRDRIDSRLHTQRRTDRQHLHEALAHTRYLDLLAQIAAWVDEPPFTGAAHRRADGLERFTRRANKKVTRALSAANSSGDIELLHRARKRAKRARYAAEAASPVSGRRALRHADRYKRLQDLLGEHQDSAVAAQLLRELGAAAGVTAGENGFTYGLLYQREQERAAAARAKAQRVARKYR
ncbi:CYTH and CHAD domain-containing protein [Amnibacterium sp. CER49]|uniref:CYTH and CHAD domain-containing protein n=1 Tax=Amnibacterium sp. CER49 TaxID=3039161 RepID=UPI00244B7DC5|nr:CYTH and CHAD domain-containing protein [Amnibacterium sp. CER49]MDH2444090.1 CYTH and CHAD domain-containing protein [Amnibacterium sp. CER49]